MNRLQRDMRRIQAAGLAANRQLRHVPIESRRALILAERLRDLELQWRNLNGRAKMLTPLYDLLERKGNKGDSR